MENEREPAQNPPAVSSPDTPAEAEPQHEPEPTPEPQPEPEPAPAPEPPVARPRETGLAFYTKFVVLLFFISYSIAFVVGNDRKIHVDFVFAETDVSLIWTILLLLAVGLVGGLLASHLYRRHGRKKPGKP